ncbi:MAG: hypothetical protein GY707_12215 [Desulfobacteraceae bacterium]|nr:hypothetical protein [Desulfobacteraceae bacterium]
MNKKLAHTILFLGNFFCFWGIWYGYHDFKHTLMEISKQVDSISIGSRDGFFIVAIGFPLIYLFIIIEHFRSDLLSKYKRFMNPGAIALVIVLPPD